MRSTGGDWAAARRWAPRSAGATSAAPETTPAAIHGWMPGVDNRRDRGTGNRDALDASCGWSATSRLDPSRFVACAGSDRRGATRQEDRIAKHREAVDLHECALI